MIPASSRLPVRCRARAGVDLGSIRGRSAERTAGWSADGIQAGRPPAWQGRGRGCPWLAAARGVARNRGRNGSGGPAL